MHCIALHCNVLYLKNKKNTGCDAHGCFGESLQEVKGDKSGAEGDKKDKKMRGKKRKKSAVSRKRSPDKAPRQLQRLVKYKS